MNKKEAINRVFMEREYDESIGLYIDYDTVKKIIEQIEEPFDWEKTEWEAVEEPEKAVIPKFVADWIEYVKSKDGTLKEALEFIAQPDEVYGWVYANDYNKSEVLAKAWINGYEIEKEPLFYAKVKGHELLMDKDNMYWNYAEDDCELGILDNSEIGSYKTKFTKQQWNNLGIDDTNADFEGVES